MPAIARKQISRLVTFGRRGHTVYYDPERNPQTGRVTSTSRLEGYDDPARFELALQGKHPQDGGLDEGTEVDGAFVVDLLPLLDDEHSSIVRLVMRAPLVDTSLPDDRIERFASDEQSRWFAGVLATASPAFAGMVASQVVHEQGPRRAQAGPLDQVSVSAYVAYWRENGAHIGRVTGDRITWE